MPKADWSGGKVQIAWDRPKADARAILLLAHGAGGDVNDQLLKAVAAGLAADHIAVLRFNFPYRELGRRAPGAQSQSENCYRDIANAIREPGVPLYCGGKSYGGRIGSHIVSDGFEADGLTFISYPLHPPGKPDRLRDEHLHRIQKPMLFCQGTKDPFANPQLLRRVVGSLGKATLHEIDGGDHSLNVRGRKRTDVVDELVQTIAAFVS
ncbi:MAG: alpha/beta family hydrolase [Actinomycetota bacterium]